MHARPRLVPAVRVGSVYGRSAGKSPRNIVRRDKGSQAHLLRSAGVPRAVCGANLHQLARMAAADVRVGAFRAHHRPSEGLRRLRQRVRRSRSAQPAGLRHRPAVACVRDLSRERTPVLADEPRADPRRAGRSRQRRGPAVAPLLLRQGSSPTAGSRDALLRLPHDPPLHCAALVHRGWRGLHGDLDGRRSGPRARWLRRNGVPRDGARRRPFLRSAGTGLARHSRRFPVRGKCLSLRHAVLHLARLRLFARKGRRLDPARRRERARLRRPVPARVRHPSGPGLERLDRLRA